MGLLINRFVSMNARLLRLCAARRPRKPLLVESKARIVCLTAGGTSEMIDTLPLLHGLRRHYPRALIAVACDSQVAPIAQACPAVNVVVVYKRSRIPGWGMLRNGGRLQGFDWVLAATPGFNRRLAVLTRLSNADVRIGFEQRVDRKSEYFTDPVLLSVEADEEHRIETLMRLLKPLGLIKRTGWGVDLSLSLPKSALASAEEIRSEKPFTKYSSFILINLTAAFWRKFREEDFIALISRILGSTSSAIGLIASSKEEQAAREIAMCMGTDRITVLDPISPIELAALLKQAAFLLTTQDETAHLAAAMGTPSLVFWLKGDFKKTHSRGRNQVFVHPLPGEKTFPVERIWQTLQPLLAAKKTTKEKWSEMQELPPAPDFMS
jgi:heptosyltransferase-3